MQGVYINMDDCWIDRNMKIRIVFLDRRSHRGRSSYGKEPVIRDWTYYPGSVPVRSYSDQSGIRSVSITIRAARGIEPTHLAAEKITKSVGQTRDGFRPAFPSSRKRNCWPLTWPGSVELGRSWRASAVPSMVIKPAGSLKIRIVYLQGRKTSLKSKKITVLWWRVTGERRTLGRPWGRVRRVGVVQSGSRSWLCSRSPIINCRWSCSETRVQWWRRNSGKKLRGTGSFIRAALSGKQVYEKFRKIQNI